MSSRQPITPTPVQAEYHQTHHVIGLSACPLCGWKSMVIRSYGQSQAGRSYYVNCERCANDENAGNIEGPVRQSAEEAGKAFNEAMKKFSQSFMRGDGGEY